MTHLIGLLHGQEETFPAALIAELNARPGFHAETASVGGVGKPPYHVLVDRLSQRVPFYASYVRQCVQAGCVVLNDPTWAQGLDRGTLAVPGVEVVPTVVLPTQQQPAGVTSEDLGNLLYPLPWEDYLEFVGLPAVLRPAALGPGRSVVVHSLRHLWNEFARTGQQVMCLQSELNPEAHLLVLVAGEVALGLGWDPTVREYRLQADLERGPAVAAVAAAQTFRRATGCDLVGLEFALCGGKPILTDLQLVPDLDWWSISEKAFTRVVGAVADLVCERATAKKGK